MNFDSDIKLGDVLYIDIETQCSVNLPKTGVYKYADGEDFTVLLFAYCINNRPVQVVDVACGEKVPSEILNALNMPSIIKVAHNASFERVCLSRWLKDLGVLTTDDKFLDPIGWHCTKFLCNVYGIPATLAKAGAALNLPIQKMPEGKDLIFLFSVPDEHGNYGTPEDYPDKWDTFKKYNIVDVETEIALLEALEKQATEQRPINDQLWKEYYTQQSINDLRK